MAGFRRLGEIGRGVCVIKYGACGGGAHFLGFLCLCQDRTKWLPLLSIVTWLDDFFFSIRIAKSCFAVEMQCEPLSCPILDLFFLFAPSTCILNHFSRKAFCSWPIMKSEIITPWGHGLPSFSFTLVYAVFELFFILVSFDI